MQAFRAQHACAKISRNGKDYIAVFGGVYDQAASATATIELYDLSLRPAAWETITGLSLGIPFPGVRGSLVKVFDVNICSAMFISADLKTVRVCSGNYSWSNYFVSNYLYSSAKLAIVDASFLGGNTIW